MTVWDVKCLLEEEDEELNDNKFLSSDNSESDYSSDCASSDSSAASDARNVPLTSSKNFFLS